MTKKPKTAKALAVKLGTVATDKVDPQSAPKQAASKGAKPPAAVQATRKATRNSSKQAHVLEMLRRTGGVTIPQIMDATGWQQHSVRGFLSGAVKKKLGLKVISEKSKNGIRTYRVKAA